MVPDVGVLKNRLFGTHAYPRTDKHGTRKPQMNYQERATPRKIRRVHIVLTRRVTKRLTHPVPNTLAQAALFEQVDSAIVPFVAEVCPSFVGWREVRSAVGSFGREVENGKRVFVDEED